MIAKPSRPEPAPAASSLPKLCGADIELGNFVLGLDRAGGSAPEASRALLRQFEGFPRVRRYTQSCGCPTCRAQQRGGDDGPGHTAYTGYDPQDWGRKYLAANGGCVYIDLDHLELCLPEVRGAHDHVAAWHAMLRLAREALDRANAKLPSGQRIEVLVNNSDGSGNSYGSHIDFLVTRRCFQNLFERKLHYQLILASYLTSSIVFTGAGKVGAENGCPPVDYQLSQRGDFFECLTGIQTTFNRPLVNARDEALAKDGMARLHVIFFDNTLAHGSSLLKVGVTQILLAMIEQERVNTALILDDPLAALLQWGHDPTLRAKARLASGSEFTAVEMQLAFLDRACRFVATGRAEGIVPRVTEIMALWEDTLLKLKAGHLDALSPRLDWVLKRSILERAMAQHPELAWGSPQLKVLDHKYASLDPGGLYWAFERSGAVEQLVPDAEIERFVHEPPADTRAWLRAQILRRADPDLIDDVDWEKIRLKSSDHRSGYYPSYTYRTLKMDNPLEFTEARCARHFDGDRPLAEALDALGLEETDSWGRPTHSARADLGTEVSPKTFYLPAFGPGSPEAGTPGLTP